MATSTKRGAAVSVADQNRQTGRVFALTLMGGFLFITLLAYWRGAQTVAITASALGAISLLAAVLMPGRLEPARLAWMKFGEIIGHVTTPILMAIVYYAIVTPIGFVRRVATPARRTTTDSHWHQRPALPPAARMERQF